MARWAYGLGIGALVAALGALVAAACLPDLTLNLCGNGTIDPGESCDPGANLNAGCSTFCTVVCPSNLTTDGGPRFIEATSTDHCYFTTKKRGTFDDGKALCGEANAHPVTFVDDDEVSFVGGGLSPEWPGGRYWVGLSRPAANGPYASLAPNEPGWNAPDDCQGCYIYGVTGLALVRVDAGAGPAQGVIATNVSSSSTTMEVTAANAPAEVVCEREPIGQRSVACNNGSYCFMIPAGLKKRYLYNPSFMSADAAETYCASLSDASVGSLVVFESRAEREQVIYELSQLNGGGGITPQFWIGLSKGEQPDAGAAGHGQWVWDDGVAAGPSSMASRPSVWGRNQPESGSGPSRAYINLSNQYDTGLAYARSDSANGTPLPFVCNY